MTNSDPKQQYEGAILQQLIKNAEKLAVIEFEINQIKPKVNKIDTLEEKITSIESDVIQVKKDSEFAKWLLITIAIGVLINIFSQPILGWLV